MDYTGGLSIAISSSQVGTIYGRTGHSGPPLFCLCRDSHGPARGLHFPPQSVCNLLLSSAISGIFLERMLAVGSGPLFSLTYCYRGDKPDLGELKAFKIDPNFYPCDGKETCSLRVLDAIKG